MDFTMNAWESTEMLMYGRCLLSFSITFHLPQSLKDKFSAFMVVFPQVSIPSIKSDNSIEFKKSPTKGKFFPTNNYK